MPSIRRRDALTTPTAATKARSAVGPTAVWAGWTPGRNELERPHYYRRASCGSRPDHALDLHGPLEVWKSGEERTDRRSRWVPDAQASEAIRCASLVTSASRSVGRAARFSM